MSKRLRFRRRPSVRGTPAKWSTVATTLHLARRKYEREVAAIRRAGGTPDLSTVSLDDLLSERDETAPVPVLTNERNGRRRIERVIVMSADDATTYYVSRGTPCRRDDQAKGRGGER